MLVDSCAMLRQAKVPAAETPPLARVPTATATETAKALERELASAEGGRAWLRRLASWGVVALLIAGGVTWRIKTRPPPQSRYVLAPITKGDVVESVQSTGTVQPLTQVQVGAQIWGASPRFSSTSTRK